MYGRELGGGTNFWATGGRDDVGTEESDRTILRPVHWCHAGELEKASVFATATIIELVIFERRLLNFRVMGESRE